MRTFAGSGTTPASSEARASVYEPVSTSIANVESASSAASVTGLIAPGAVDSGAYSAPAVVLDVASDVASAGAGYCVRELDSLPES